MKYQMKLTLLERMNSLGVVVDSDGLFCVIGNDGALSVAISAHVNELRSAA